MFVLPALILGAALSGDVKKDFVDKPYALDVSGTSRSVKAGDSGVFSLRIKPIKGYKVSREAPLKITLKSEGLALKKTKLKQGDSKDRKSKDPIFNVDFATEKPGDQAIGVKAVFFVCTEEICVRKQEKLDVKVSVKP